MFQHDELRQGARLVHEAPEGSRITYAGGDLFLVTGPTHAPYHVNFDGIVTAINPVDDAGGGRDDAATQPGVG